MAKLEMIYNCLSEKLMQEISKFWEAKDIPSSKLAIDTDQL